MSEGSELSERTPPDESNRTAALLGLYLVSFTNALGSQTLVTLIPEYAVLFQASPYWIGAFTTAFALAGTVIVLPVGWLSDRVGKATVLRWGLAVSIVSYILFLFAHDEVTFAVGRVIQGIGITSGAMTSLALVGEIAGEGERGRMIGTFNSIRNMSGAIGAAAAGWMLGQFGILAPNVVLIIVSITALFLVSRSRHMDSFDVARARGFPLTLLARSTAIQAMAAFRVLYGFGVVMTRTFVPIYVGITLGLGPLYVGLVISAEQTVNMLFQRFTGSLSDRFGRFPMVTLGGCLYAVGLVILTTQRTPYALIAANGFLGLADAIREPASMAAFADEGQKTGSVGSAFAIRQILWRPSMVLAPMMGGAVMAALGVRSVFYLALAFTIAGVLGVRLVLTLRGTSDGVRQATSQH